MTDQPNEWRDEQGRWIRDERHNNGCILLFAENTAHYLSPAAARFLIKVLPEALGIHGKPAPSEAQLMASFGSVPELAEYANAEKRAKSLDALDAKIVEAAERWAADQLRPRVFGDARALLDAVEAKRSALKPTGG